MTIPAGTFIILPTQALQMNPQYYPEPEKFLPERFNPDHEAYDSQRPYLSFGIGPRNCIGLRFGKIQSKVGLISALQEFSFDLAANTKRPLVMDPASFVLSTAGGMNLRISHRKL